MAPPVLFVTGHVPPDRVGAFAALHERAGIEVAIFGGRRRHATAGAPGDADAGADLPFPHRRVAQREVFALARRGEHRAVVCGTAGRIALPAAYAGARAARRPFLLWSALWAEPRSPAHLAARPLMRRVYRGADAVLAYGPHVAAHARAQGARNVHIAPQAVDNAFWSAPSEPGARPRTRPHAGFAALYVGRLEREKGVEVLLAAFRGRESELTLVGEGPLRAAAAAAGARTPGALAPAEVRNFYAASDVLLIPSIPTATFREPWGLVANEAMNQRLPVIATDAVGAAAGGLVRDGRTGLVVPAGDADALAAAVERLRGDPGLRERLGATGAEDVAAYTHTAWADGFAEALATTGGC